MNARLILSTLPIMAILAILRPSFALLVWLLLCGQPACAEASPARPPAVAVDVNVERVDTDGNRGYQVYQVNAAGNVAAAPGAVWRILTDYERMAEFVPGLHSTRVLARSGEQTILEQHGVAHLLFLRRQIRLLVQVREQAMTQIDISLIDGDMLVYNCTWQLVPLPQTGGTRIVYSGLLAPKFYVPAMFGASLIRADIAKMMAAVLARLDRPG